MDTHLHMNAHTRVNTCEHPPFEHKPCSAQRTEAAHKSPLSQIHTLAHMLSKKHTTAYKS